MGLSSSRLPAPLLAVTGMSAAAAAVPEPNVSAGLAEGQKQLAKEYPELAQAANGAMQVGTAYSNGGLQAAGDATMQIGTQTLAVNPYVGAGLIVTGYAMKQYDGWAGSIDAERDYPKARRVYIDPSLLATLPLREIANGMAEIIKAGAIADSALFDLTHYLLHDGGVLEHRPLLVPHHHLDQVAHVPYASTDHWHRAVHEE
jgi:hypothetical protein